MDREGITIFGKIITCSLRCIGPHENDFQHADGLGKRFHINLALLPTALLIFVGKM